MLRVSLDDMVLQILLLDKGDPAEFLAAAVNPPTDLAVANSIKYLCELQVRRAGVRHLVLGVFVRSTFYRSL